MDIFDFFHFTRGGKIRYHWHLLPVREWLVLDLLAGRAEDNSRMRWDGDDGRGLYWYRKSVGEKLRKAIGVYASNNGMTYGVNFVKPYEEFRVFINPRD